MHYDIQDGDPNTFDDWFVLRIGLGQRQSLATIHNYAQLPEGLEVRVLSGERVTDENPVNSSRDL